MIDKTTATNIEAKIPSNLYDEVRKDIVQRFEKFDCVQAIYEFGKTKNVGISDLDLALVLSNDTRHVPYLQDELQRIYQEESYRTVLCGGTLMIFSEADFRNVHYLDDIEPNLLAGDAINFNTPSVSESKLILICQILDWLPERLLSLRSAVVQGNSPISLLGYLYSICYTFKKISDFVPYGSKERQRFIVSTVSLRTRWFDLDSDKKQIELAALIKNVFTLGFKDLVNVVNQLQVTCKYQPVVLNSITASFSLSSLKRYVSSNTTSFGYLEVEENSTFQAQIQVPLLWFYLWYFYGKQTGPISEELAMHILVEPGNALETEPPFSTDLIMMLNKRIELCNSMAYFLKGCGIQKGLYKFGWFF